MLSERDLGHLALFSCLLILAGGCVTPRAVNEARAVTHGGDVDGGDTHAGDARTGDADVGAAHGGNGDAGHAGFDAHGWLRFVPPERGTQALADRLDRAHTFARSFTGLEQHGALFPTSSPDGGLERDSGNVLSANPVLPAVTVTLSDASGPPASAHGPDRITVNTTALGRDDVDGIFAHELTHVLDLRHLGNHVAAIPRYLMEGRGLAVGYAYRQSINQRAKDDEARILLLRRIDATEAKQWLARFRTGPDARALSAEKKLGRAMAVGVFFVDWLRVRFGADALHRLSLAIAETGAGSAFDDSLGKHFGEDLAQLEAGFVSHLAATAGDESARLKGTMYERAASGQ